MNVLIIDHRDSFTFNIAAYVEDVTGVRPTVRDYTEEFSPSYLATFDAIILSPGPGRVDNPADIGSSLNILQTCEIPMLGICLGHQALAYAHGGGTALAPEPVHGQLSEITHDGTGLFADLPSPLSVVRYHSLIADPIPPQLMVTARTADGIPMALAHRDRPQWGVQFHPESIGGFDGRTLIRNFLTLAAHSGQRYVVETLEIDHEVALENHLEAASFFLDSSDRSHSDGACSYLGFGEGPLATVITGEHLDVLEHLHLPVDTSAVAHTGLDFTLGWVGYISYELKADVGGSDRHQSREPRVYFQLADRMVAVNHRTQRSYILVAWDRTRPETRTEQLQWATQLRSCLLHASTQVPAPVSAPQPAIEVSNLRAQHTKAEYLAAIARCQDAIVAGESYEICLTTQLMATAETFDPVAAYQRLREHSPAPFGALLRCGETVVMSSSPERFLRVTAQGVLESRPIKGTRARAKDPVRDAQLREDLATNTKDRAENLMIVDLVRNDLTRVAAPHSVAVERFCQVETFATVHQLVSTITATLAPEATLVDVIRATFPGGSMTGAPKIRTMELIDDLEGAARGIYSGALGYIGFDGAMDLSMVIRTLVCQGNEIRYGVGGAILAVSDPETEYREIMTKAAPFLHLIGQEFPEQ
ncbi:aminodeoxychorismate synthase component I [Corynebacterium sp. HS2168-gen11]|uniref:aminodeoxychorismate synthase component I n=1 Tax=Corynebacterium sp. HS2168-gen11 TaxID=2974027 RepID=UPI00216AFAF2|nr:aminodeoxychorismate synthase component I [Corynebacterium sp. HS2168-gen11]MCS4534973.1 aminodeoxychorismate synthase component I [Corynebacterium sp. HS2168-gen11]